MLWSKQIDLALLLLRVVFGGMMLFNHGWGKVVTLFTGDPTEFADVLGMGAPASLALASFAEFLCAALIVLGLFTRWAVVPLIVTMLVAIFLIHWDGPFQKMELAVIYLTAFFAIGLAGPGWYSADAQFRKILP
ncbi:MAG: DoxX family protein [Saprospiraceae bacterium]|nr:MAG: DoxX family protein [Saprospiraceae bacterium]